MTMLEPDLEVTFIYCSAEQRQGQKNLGHGMRAPISGNITASLYIDHRRLDVAKMYTKSACLARPTSSRH